MTLNVPSRAARFVVPAGENGTCQVCLNDRTVYTITRTGTGPRHRRGLTYRSAICGYCATGLVSAAPAEPNATIRRFSVVGLVRIVSSLDIPEAEAALIDFANHQEQAQQEAEARLDAWEDRRASGW